jgi:hypothetical protein
LPSSEFRLPTNPKLPQLKQSATPVINAAISEREIKATKRFAPIKVVRNKLRVVGRNKSAIALGAAAKPIATAIKLNDIPPNALTRIR